MKLPSVVSKLFTNKYFLYFVVILSVVNLIGYVSLGNLTSVVAFGIIGYLTSMFSKNMAIILLVALLATNLLVAGNYIKEGLENMPSTTPSGGSSTAPKPADAKKAPLATSSSGTPLYPPNVIVPTTEADLASATGTTDSFEPMEAGGIPANVNNKKNDKNRIDYGTTIENAYDDLSKILGGDGISKLTQDTQGLMQQQLKLAEAMSSMTPLLNQAKDMLSNFDLGSIDQLKGLVGGITKN